MAGNESRPRPAEEITCSNFSKLAVGHQHRVDFLKVQHENNWLHGGQCGKQLNADEINCKLCCCCSLCWCCERLVGKVIAKKKSCCKRDNLDKLFTVNYHSRLQLFSLIKLILLLTNFLFRFRRKRLITINDSSSAPIQQGTRALFHDLTRPKHCKNPSVDATNHHDEKCTILRHQHKLISREKFDVNSSKFITTVGIVLIVLQIIISQHSSKSFVVGAQNGFFTKQRYQINQFQVASTLQNEQAYDNDNNKNNYQPIGEPQPLIMRPLIELGSGDGHPLRSSSSSSSTFASDQLNDNHISSSLIEAKCWNNYENDNDCKQLNFIMAPDGQSGRSNSHQDQASNSGQSLGVGDNINRNNNNDDDDRLITQVVIYESSSPINEDIEPSSKTISKYIDQSSPSAATTRSPSLFTQTPPWVPSAPRGGSSKSHNDDMQSPGAWAKGDTATTGRPDDLFSATRPPIGQVATPKPIRKDNVSHASSNRPSKPKSGTVERKCRDENDSDCDDEDVDSKTSPSTSRDDDNEDNGGDDDGADDESPGADNATDNDREEMSNRKPSSKSSSDERLDETGSGDGRGPPSDDNDDSTDDGDDIGDNNISESSGDIEEQNHSNEPKFLEITTTQVSANDLDSNNNNIDIGDRATTETNPSATPGATIVSLASTTTTSSSAIIRPTGAEIEVIVHSTLPKDFPTNGLPSDDQTTIATSGVAPSSAPDDTVRVQPIYPSTSTTSDSSSADGLIYGVTNGQVDDSDPQTPQTVGIDDPLNRFLPIPPPSQRLQFETNFHKAVEQPLQEFSPTPSGNNNEQQQLNTLPIKRPQLSSSEIIGGGWSTRKPLTMGPKPLLGDDSIGNNNNNNFQPPTRQSYSSSSGNFNNIAKQSKPNADILPAIVYAAIAILIVAVLIIVLIGVVFWHKNALRRRALIQKAHLMNGRSQQHPGMVASMSYASQLIQQQQHQPQHPPAPPVAQMHQQPGLLSTYAPGKGLNAAQGVTSSLIKLNGDGQQHNSETGEQQTQNMMLLDDELANGQTGANEHSIEGKNPSRLSNQGQNEHGPPAQQQPSLSNERQLNNQSSWSTEDPVTSTSSGSQRTQDDGLSQQQQRSTHQHPSQYPNSLSDGRQNSSSISDSQCSPDPGIQRQPVATTGAMEVGPDGCQVAINHQNMVTYRQPAGLAPRGVVQPMAGRYMTSRHGSPMMITQQQLHHQNGIGQQTNGIEPKYFPSDLFDSTDRGSFDSIKQQISRQAPASSSRVGLVHAVDNPSGDSAGQQVPYGRNVPPPQARMGAFESSRSMGGPAAIGQFHGGSNFMISNLQQVTISPQKIAMNPLATLGRRYPPGTGLNRNIYSEDSSSFMTTSPSLARTSSSSSFAFNLAAATAANQQHQTQSIQARSLIDPSGRVINDYTQSGAFVGEENLTNGNAPPVLGRRDRSEAWFV